MRDYYDVLGVSKTASIEEVKEAYRKRAAATHPDVNKDPNATEQFKEVQEAFEHLSDPNKRARYNGPQPRQSRKSHQPNPFHQSNPFEGGFNPADFEQIFKDIFGGENRHRGRDIQVRIEIELEESQKGCTKQVPYQKRPHCKGCHGTGLASFMRCSACGGTGVKSIQSAPFQLQSQCPVCFGTGKLNPVKCTHCAGSGFGATQDHVADVVVPAGIENGMQVRVPNLGEASQDVGMTGNLLVFVLVKEHSIFQRKGADLTLEIPVGYTQLLYGVQIDIPTLSKDKIKAEIPAGSHPNTKIRIKGRGFCDIKQPTHIGDLVATLKVEMPKIKEIDEEYKKVLEQLVEMEKKHIGPRRKKFNEQE